MPTNDTSIAEPATRRSQRDEAIRGGQAKPRQSSAMALKRRTAVRRRRHGAKKRKPPATILQWQISPAGNRSIFYLTTKRTMDIVGSLAMLIILSPLLLAVTAVLAVTARGRPFFVQERVGFLGRPFRLFKFRTMVLNAETIRHTVVNQKDGPIFKNATDPRITRFGRLLRRTSVDELPQLLNILKGDMSLIGPRPPLAKEVAEYEPWHSKRLSVKPGLTCLWQVSGRSEIAFHRWMLMDLWYVRNQSLWTDCRLLVLTPWAVLSRRGAY